MAQNCAVFSDSLKGSLIVGTASQTEGYTRARIGRKGSLAIPLPPCAVKPFRYRNRARHNLSTPEHHSVIMNGSRVFQPNDWQVVQAKTLRNLDDAGYLQKGVLGYGEADPKLTKELQVLSSYVEKVFLNAPVKRGILPGTLAKLISDVVEDFEPGSESAVKHVLVMWLIRNVCLIADLLFDELKVTGTLDFDTDWISQSFEAIGQFRGTFETGFMAQMVQWCWEMEKLKHNPAEMNEGRRDKLLRIFRAHTWMELTRRVEQADAAGSSHHTPAQSLNCSDMSTSDILDRISLLRDQISVLSTELSRRRFEVVENFTQPSGFSVSGQAPSSGLRGSF
jgi:hypothetical protein